MRAFLVYFLIWKGGMVWALLVLVVVFVVG